jgi:hypothetical protein
MSPPAHHKSIAKHLLAACPGLKVTQMRADGTAHMQAIAEMQSWPAPGYVTYATIGLSDHGGFELSTTTPVRFQSVIKAVFDLASYVAAGNRKLAAGATFEKILGRYYTKSEAAHWLVRNESPKSVVIAPHILPTGTVTWLMAWPITSDELVWLGGGAGLGPLLDEADLRAFDLDRGSLDGVPSFEPWAAKG